MNKPHIVYGCITCGFIFNKITKKVCPACGSKRINEYETDRTVLMNISDVCYFSIVKDLEKKRKEKD